MAITMVAYCLTKRSGLACVVFIPDQPGLHAQDFFAECVLALNSTYFVQGQPHQQFSHEFNQLFPHARNASSRGGLTRFYAMYG